MTLFLFLCPLNQSIRLVDSQKDCKAVSSLYMEADAGRSTVGR
jgi:hypothetical protein